MRIGASGALCLALLLPAPAGCSRRHDPTPPPKAQPEAAPFWKGMWARADESRAGGQLPVAGPPGTLAFRVLPWASVYIDGVLVGTTPLDPLRVPAGSHVVRFTNDALQVEASQTVEVKPGETRMVRQEWPRR